MSGLVALTAAFLLVPACANADATGKQTVQRRFSSPTIRHQNPGAWIPWLGLDKAPSRYELQVSSGLALPGTAFSDQLFSGTRLRLRNGTAATPRSFTFLAGALPAGEDGWPGGAGYTTGLVWQSRYRGDDHVGMGVYYSQAPGSGNPGSQWLYSLHGTVTSIPGLSGYTLNAELAALQRRGAYPAGSDPMGMRLRFSSPVGSSLQYHLTVARYGSGFRPLNSVVACDWRAVRAGASYRFSSGMVLKAHTDYGQQNFELDHPVSQREAGISLSGHFLHPLTTPWVADIGNAIRGGIASGGVVLNLIGRAVMMLTQPIWGDWDYRLDMTMRETDSAMWNRDSLYHGFRLAANRPLDLGFLNASVGTGLAWEEYSNASLEDTFEAGMAFNLRMHAHTIGFDVGYLSRQPAGPRGDHEAMKVSVSYTYTFGEGPVAAAPVAPAWYQANGAGF